MAEKKFELETMRHSLSHVLAMAVLEMFPDAKLGIGPAIENGFYYDFDLPRALVPEDLPKLEKKMREIIEKNLAFEKSEVEISQAIEKFDKQNYKLELIKDLKSSGNDKVSLYKTGEFVDLCAGPHVDTTSDLKNVGFKLDKIAGAYWRGSEKNKMLQRIYALAFENESELKKYEEIILEAEKRDHRKLATELDLFSFHKEGPNFVFWHDNGWIVFQKMLEYWRQVHRRERYEEVNTPIMMLKEVWEQSGHMKNYAERMYLARTPDEKDYSYAVKPMNCIGGMLIYRTKVHSYRDLPVKMGEIGLVHRYEGSGEVHGLMRLRQFTQDDAHIYCRPDQVKEEIKKVFDLCFEMYEKFGMKVDHIELSTRPEKSVGSDEVWEKAESTMKEILAENKIEHKVNEGDGAFYGPKFDFHLKDAIGRTWQCGTIQLDFANPETFDLTYIDEKGEKVRPVMIHRVIYGAIERFLGIYIENVAGAFPTWLAPVQAIVLPISDKHLDYAAKIEKELNEAGIRVKVDDRTESIGKKIREAEMQKIPYMLIVGDKEIEAEKVAVRKYGEGDKGQEDLSAVIKEVKE
ncbi:MAG: threonine--tRNA ligase [Patescibacteria group bacterium]|jgi:threonyl-tRNA synthetase